MKTGVNGKAVCPCPLCKTPLDPNPNPNPNPNPVVAEEMENLYRVQFFRFVNNPQTGEIDRVPVSVNNTSDTDMVILTDYFIDQIPETNDNNFLFFGDEAGTNPYGYIQLYDGQDDVVINEGDMDINTDPPIDIQSVTITRVPNFNT